MSVEEGKIMKVVAIDDYSLFEPSDAKNSDLRQDFREIKEDPAFTVLNARSLRFCWYVANRTSPLAGMKNHKERMKQAVTTVWGSKWETNIEAFELYHGKVSIEMKAAIERMAQFNPSKRLRARMMAEYAFDKANDIIMASQKEIDDMDFDERKAYMKTLLEIMADLPKLIAQCEEGFGIKIKSTKEVTKKYLTVKDIVNELGK